MRYFPAPSTTRVTQSSLAPRTTPAAFGETSTPIRCDLDQSYTLVISISARLG